MFINYRAHQEIQTVVAFLTTRVKKTDEGDWGKLKRILRYLKGNMKLKLTLSVCDIPVVKWWVYASYTVHRDC